MGYIKIIVLSAVVALAITFMIQNITPLSHPLSLRLNLFFLHWQSTPYATYLIILLAFFIGLLAASLVGIAERWRLRSQVWTQKKDIEKLHRELSSLRNLPVTGDAVVAGQPEVAANHLAAAAPRLEPKGAGQSAPLVKSGPLPKSAPPLKPPAPARPEPAAAAPKDDSPLKPAPLGPAQKPAPDNKPKLPGDKDKP
ncbi:MAG: LapA family protein [Thermodesulfobacteriota bacterium]